MRFSNAIALLAIVASTNGAGADEWDNCRGGSDLERIIASCTKLIETPGIDPASVGHAFSRRAYGYARSGHEERAIRDYDEAIRILLSVRNPDPHDPKWRLLNNYRAIAYNNRSNAYFLLGKAAQSCRTRTRLWSLLRKNLIFTPSVAPRDSRSATSRGRSATTMRQWRSVALGGLNTINAG